MVLGTDDVKLEAAYNLIKSANFTVKTNSTDDSPSETLKNALVKVVNMDKILSLHLFKAHKRPMLSLADQIVLDEFRKRFSLKTPLKIPEKTLSVVLKEYSDAFDEIWAAYENSSPNSSVLIAKVSENVQAATSAISYPSTIGVFRDKQLVLDLKTNSSLADSFFDKFNPKLIDSIKASRGNMDSAVKYAIIMLFAVLISLKPRMEMLWMQQTNFLTFAFAIMSMVHLVS